MNKILLVIQREYLTRVRKKSFWVLTLLVPILIVTIYAIPIYLATNSLEETHVAVVDETGLYTDFQSTDNVIYHYMDSFDTALVGHSDTVDVMLYIPRPTSGVVPTETFVYYSKDAPSPSVKSNIDKQCQDMLRNNILLDVYNINRDDYEQIKNTS
ncbi:MAG: ABC transporter permease, partial [Bacteroidales bacterium]|nr:ABC transporter permease [Bacteroidales bacterium]